MSRWLGGPAVVAAAAGLLLAAGLYLRAASLLDRELEKRDFLGREVAKLDVEIAEVKELKPMIASFLARKAVIEVLNRDRGQGVQLLNELARRRPDGIRLVAITYVGRRATVQGLAASDQALQGFISAVAASPALQAPEEVARKGSEFSFRIAFRKEPGA